MDDELVLLTSFFNLADARRQDSADTFRVDPSVSSSTSPDGTAALYIVTESSATGHMGPRARRVAADTVAWEYSTHADEPPAARLKAALRAAHQSVEHEFDGHVTVGVSVIAIEADTVYLGQVAPTQVYVLHEDSLASIAAGIEGTAPFARALGSRSGPRITVFRDQVGPDDVLALCSSWFHRGVDTDDLRECFAAGSADGIAESLLDLAKQHDARDVTAIVIEAVLSRDLEDDASQEPAPSFTEQVDMAVQALTGVGKMLWQELRYVPEVAAGNGAHVPPGKRDTVSARPASHDAAVETEERNGQPSDWSGGARDRTHEVPAIAGDPAARGNAGHSLDTEAVGDGMTDEVPIVPVDEFDWLPDVEESNGTGQPRAASGNEWQQETRVTEPTGSDTSPTDRKRWQPHGSEDTSSTADESRTVPDYDTEATESEARPDKRRWKRPRRARPVMRSQPETEIQPEPIRQDEARGASELEQVNSRIQNDPELGDAMPPVQAFDDTSTVEPSRIYATTKDIRAVNKHRPRRFGGSRTVMDGLAGPKVIRPGDSDIDLRRPITRSTPPAVIWASAVAMIVLVAAGIFIYLSHRHRTTVTVNPYPAKARQDLALALAAKTPAQQDAWLAKAQQRISQARVFGHVKPATLIGLQTKWRTTSDNLHHVTREYTPTRITDFGGFPSANPSEISALPGQIFVLDRGRNSVFSVSTNGGSTSGPSEIAKSGDIVSTLTVSKPVHLTVDAKLPGTVVILDDKNQMVRYAGNSKTATPLTQPSQAPLHPVGIATSDPDVYLLDPSNNQVWRYALGITGYNPLFQPYFDVVKPTLTKAVSFVLDGTDLYVLGSDGVVQKFDYQENPQKFTMPKLAIPLNKPTQIFAEAGTNWLWVADPINKRIVQLDKSGNFSHAYVSGSASMDLGALRSFTVGPAGNTLYVLTGSQLLQFPVSR